MFFFRKKKIKETQLAIAEINKKIAKIEKDMEKIFNHSLENKVNIEHLTINNPVVESLNFRLDSLDVEEISGALNLGNNFGIRVNQTPEESPKNSNKINKKSTDIKNDSKFKSFEKTDTGYTIKFKQD